VLGFAADGDERQPERQPEGRLGAEEGNEEILEPELKPGHARPSEEDAVHVPADDSEAVEETHVLDLEASLPEAGDQLAPLVPAVVVDRPVDRPVEPPVRRDQ